MTARIDVARTFGEALRSARLRAGLTQQQLADFSTLSVRAIRDLEAERTGIPRRGTVALLAVQLGLSGSGLKRFEELARGAEGDCEDSTGLAGKIASIWRGDGDQVVRLSPHEVPQWYDRLIETDMQHTLVLLEGADDLAAEVVRLLRAYPGLRMVTTG